jgi:cellulose synthase/poly-beta-1,6-N-acetylglucosamine synthase-like glycosyltransferase
MLLNTLLTIVYVVCIVILTTFAIGSITLLITYLFHRNDPVPTSSVTDWPRAAVQLPIYNELYVIERLLKACAELDYPRDKLIIQVLDDSTDETTELAAELVAGWNARGVNMQHVRRDTREGFKAGALAHGLKLLDVEMVAVLDADFVPPPDFLKRAISHLVTNPKLGAVQGRWGHINSQQNPLTRAATLALDGHFVIEQTARNRAGWLMNFNGSGGVWRVSAIESAGGWQATTLTEDMDLSYRAQLIGWRFLYLPDLVVPGEIPPQITAYKQQQARWAQGGTQCFRRLIGPVWRTSNLTLMQRVMATMHLSQYIMHPLIVLVILLTPPLLISGSLQHLNLNLLGLAGLGPPLVYSVSQQALYVDWKKRAFWSMPMLFIIGTGIAWTNSRAVIRGFLNFSDEFRRTPKFAQKLTGNAYALHLTTSTFWEIALCLYAAWGTWTALRLAPALTLYLVIYCIAFGVVALWGIHDTLMIQQAI